MCALWRTPSCSSSVPHLHAFTYLVTINMSDLSIADGELEAGGRCLGATSSTTTMSRYTNGT